MTIKRKSSRISLEEKLQQHIRKSRWAVFIPADFNDLIDQYDYDQVGRALRKLVKRGYLVKAGYGLYVKATISSFSGKPIPIIGMRELAEQAFKKLGVKIGATLAEKRYHEGLSTQVPTGRVIGIKGRISRKIRHGDITLNYEKA